MEKPWSFSHAVTADMSCGVGANWLRNCVGERNCPAFGLPGVDTDSANAAAASPPRHGRYTRNTTVSPPLAAELRFAAFAHEGMLPGNVVREGGAAESLMNAMQMTARTVNVNTRVRATWVSFGGVGATLFRVGGRFSTGNGQSVCRPGVRGVSRGSRARPSRATRRRRV